MEYSVKLYGPPCCCWCCQIGQGVWGYGDTPKAAWKSAHRTLRKALKEYRANLA